LGFTIVIVTSRSSSSGALSTSTVDPGGMLCDSTSSASGSSM
jgi:hypothetical protein